MQSEFVPKADALRQTAPIALFVYNRPDHTRRTIEALRANPLATESDLFIYSDAARDSSAVDAVREVRKLVSTVDGFRNVKIIERRENWGVDPSIIDGVTELCNEHGSVIVLEDDLVTSPWFLTFMNRALTKYEFDERVMQVSGFMFPLPNIDPSEASFLRYTTCWGWGTWRRAWAQFDATASGYAKLLNNRRQRRAFNLDGAEDYFSLLKSYVEGKIDAWDIRWYLSVFMSNGLTLFPKRSLVMNIGFDGSGVHCPVSNFPGSDLADAEILTFPPVVRDTVVWRAVKNYLFRQKGQGRLKTFVKQVLAW